MMVEGITLWVKNIIMVVLFASFLELLLPSNKMQMFVRTIMGLCIMIAILNPIIELVQNRFVIQHAPAVTATSNQTEVLYSNIHNATIRRQALAREVYCRDLAKQITATVNAIEGINSAQTFVELLPLNKEDSMPLIDKVSIYIKAKVSSKQNVDELLEKKIKHTLNNLYQFRVDQIVVLNAN